MRVTAELSLHFRRHSVDLDRSIRVSLQAMFAASLKAEALIPMEIDSAEYRVREKEHA